MKKRRKNLTAETKLHETAQKLLQQTKRGYEIGGVKHYRDNTYASVAIAQVQDQDWKTAMWISSPGTTPACLPWARCGASGARQS